MGDDTAARASGQTEKERKAHEAQVEAERSAEQAQAKAEKAAVKAAKVAGEDPDAPARPDPPLLAEAERRGADGIILNLEEE